MTRTIPERVRWAVATLDVDPADRILELGSGPGAAISLVCERLDGGTITAIDRSPVQVARALERNREHVAAGKASVRIEELERLSVGDDRFDKIFAIDVNHFWVHPAHQELDALPVPAEARWQALPLLRRHHGGDEDPPARRAARSCTLRAGVRRDLRPQDG